MLPRGSESKQQPTLFTSMSQYGYGFNMFQLGYSRMGYFHYDNWPHNLEAFGQGPIYHGLLLLAVLHRFSARWTARESAFVSSQGATHPSNASQGVKKCRSALTLESCFLEKVYVHCFWDFAISINSRTEYVLV